MASVPAHIHLDAHKVAQEITAAVRVDIDEFARNLRAAVAEEIAQAIGTELRDGSCGFIWNYALDRAIAIARGHSIAAETGQEADDAA